uniref:Uncharacterized protein n=1 Tax=Anser brachyrhynchus TaxID=132585 RepID=A0A8B9I7A6_9AVES
IGQDSLHRRDSSVCFCDEETIQGVLERTWVESYYRYCCRTNSTFVTKTEQDLLPNKTLLALVHSGGIKPRIKLPGNLGLTVHVLGTVWEMPGVPVPGSLHTHWQPPVRLGGRSSHRSRGQRRGRAESSSPQGALPSGLRWEPRPWHTVLGSLEGA